MISNVRFKTPVNSSLSISAISFGGIGVLAPRLASQFEAHLSEIMANSGELLRVVIQNKIATVKPAYRRNKKWFFKKCYRYLKIDSEYIELSGAELSAVSRFIKEDVDLELSPKSTYLIPFSEAERILSKLNDLSRCER